MKRNLIVIAALGAVIAVAWFSWIYFFGGSTQGYITAKIDRGHIRQVIHATGTINAVESVDVSSQLSGRIVKVHVDFNDKVTRDQSLAQLDQQNFLAEVNEAKAALEVAKANVKIQEAGLQKAKSGLASVKADRKSTQAGVARARASHDEAKKSLARHNSLSKKGVASKEMLDKAQASFDTTKAEIWEASANVEVTAQNVAIAQAELLQAEAQLLNAKAIVPQQEAALDLAKAELEHTIIRSPIDGIVISREVESGQTVAASLQAPKLFTIAKDLRQVKVYAKVDEADIGQVREGQSVTFSVDAFPTINFAGKVTQIRKSPNRSGNVVTYTVVIATDNPELKLLPGMTALVQIITFESGEVLRIPNRALRFKPPGEQAYTGSNFNEGDDTLLEGRPASVWLPAALMNPQPVAVRIGNSDSEFTELVAGDLQEGQQVVIGWKRVE